MAVRDVVEPAGKAARLHGPPVPQHLGTNRLVFVSMTLHGKTVARRLYPFNGALLLAGAHVWLPPVG